MLLLLVSSQTKSHSGVMRVARRESSCGCCDCHGVADRFASGPYPGTAAYTVTTASHLFVVFVGACAAFSTCYGTVHDPIQAAMAPANAFTAALWGWLCLLAVAMHGLRM